MLRNFSLVRYKLSYDSRAARPFPGMNQSASVSRCSGERGWFVLGVRQRCGDDGNTRLLSPGSFLHVGEEEAELQDGIFLFKMLKKVMFCVRTSDLPWRVSGIANYLQVFIPFTESHRIPAWRGLAGPSVGHPAQPPAQAGSPRAGGTAPRPGGS